MRKKTWMFAAMLLSGLLLAGGCGENKKNVYDQAEKDLEQAYYEYALEGYKEVIASGQLLPEAYRGAGIANLRMGKYENAITSFTNALAQQRISKALRKDLLFYRATAYLKSEKYHKALADCQTLAEEYTPDANFYFMTGIVSLEMDSYEEARGNFDRAFAENATYDMAMRIYQIYVEKNMEADGTRYLAAALKNNAADSEDHLDRGKVYYYMEDYENARKELIAAANQENTEALLLLGMVYLGQEDISNSRSMYQEYIAKAGSSAKGYNGLAQCDIYEENYASALENIKKGIDIASTEELQDLLYNELVVYERQLDFETAREKAEEYLKLFPADENAKRERTFLKSRIEHAASVEETAADEEPMESENQGEADYENTDSENIDSENADSEDMEYFDQGYENEDFEEYENTEY